MINDDQPQDPNGEQFDAEAAQAAQRVVEQQHDGNPDYIEHHPDAIQDKDKAFYVAHASKAAEEQVVSSSNKALDALTLAQASDLELSDNIGINLRALHDGQPIPRTPAGVEIGLGLEFERTRPAYKDLARKELAKAQEARTLADKQASSASDMYDNTQNLKSGKPALEEPKRPWAKKRTIIH